MSLHEHVGVVAPGLTFDRRRALVATARSRGETTSVDAELRTLRSRLSTLDVSVPSLADAKRQVASAETDLEEKRERVATLRGRLQETDDETVAAAYRSALRDLAEAETERIAAREALADTRKRARKARDEREMRLRLEDRVANLRREARRELIAAVGPVVDAAVPEVPESEASTYETAGPVTAALALVRVGRFRRPVTLACRRFDSAAGAESWLETPVVRL